MEWYIWALLIITSLHAGIYIFTVVVAFKNVITDGELIVDTSDPENDLYRVELNDGLENLSRKKTITLKVGHRSISRK